MGTHHLNLLEPWRTGKTGSGLFLWISDGVLCARLLILRYPPSLRFTFEPSNESFALFTTFWTFIIVAPSFLRIIIDQPLLIHLFISLQVDHSKVTDALYGRHSVLLDFLLTFLVESDTMSLAAREKTKQNSTVNCGFFLFFPPYLFFSHHSLSPSLVRGTRTLSRRRSLCTISISPSPP